MAGEINQADDSPESSATKTSKLNDCNSKAMKYLEQLLDAGPNEGIAEAELQLPTWFDANLFKEGQDTMKAYRFLLSTGFLYGFLSILSVPSILKVISSTGKSDNEKLSYRRYVATIFHTNSWYTEPLDQQSRLWESLVYVRKAHFRSSRMCEQMPEVGRISQRDMALTQFSLIGFTLLEADRLGLTDQRFLESSTHMWRVLGSLLGIKDEFNACGATWAETKARFELIRDRVFRPALISAGPDFIEMTKLVLESLKPVHRVLTVDATLFYIKRMARCPGYGLLDRDFEGQDRDRSLFFSLKFFDQLIVGIYVVALTFLYRIDALRWYLNSYTWLNMWILRNFPYLAIYRYGWSWAYVRIFRGTKNKVN